MAAFSELHILLSEIEHELNILLSCEYIHNNYGRLNKLNILRKELLLIVKGGKK